MAMVSAPATRNRKNRAGTKNQKQNRAGTKIQKNQGRNKNQKQISGSL